MNETNQPSDRKWLRYIETLRRSSEPVKIDELLQKRMQSFIAARHRKLSRAKR